MYKFRSFLVSKFPEILDAAAEFIKQHGFATQSRRRDETAYSSMVIIKQIQKKHIQNFLRWKILVCPCQQSVEYLKLQIKVILPVDGTKGLLMPKLDVSKIVPENLILMHTTCSLG